MSPIKNKFAREKKFRLQKKAKIQQKLQRRLAQANVELSDPATKKKRIADNVPRTLDNSRDWDPSVAIADHSNSETSPEKSTAEAKAIQDGRQDSVEAESDPFSSCFTSATDPCTPPKILVTTSPKATKATYDFCDELIGVFPGAEFIPRRKRQGFEIGRIAGWASTRGYKHLCVVNEDMKKPNAITLVHLPDGPTAYFKLASVCLTKQIFGHARATPHHPELVLNNFVTPLGQAAGRLFQTLFPPIPEFQGRQVVTFHNQRDFLFFRRHRYTFRSTEKVALQEIGPRFTLKLRSLMRGVPTVKNISQGAKPLISEDDDANHEKSNQITPETDERVVEMKPVLPKEGEYMWKWKAELNTTRRTFFL